MSMWPKLPGVIIQRFLTFLGGGGESHVPFEESSRESASIAP